MRKSILLFTTLCAGVLFFSSCRDDKDLFQGNKFERKDKLSGFEYSDKFRNFDSFQADITSGYEHGRYYSVYTTYPYDDEKQIIASPILKGLTPINAQISVPRGTTSLYVVNDEGCKEYPVGDLTITDQASPAKKNAAATRADALDKTEFEGVKQFIENNVLPEAEFNFKGEDLYKCTDLYCDEDNQLVRIWVAFIRQNVAGPIWYYTYTTDNPTAADCQFYGQDKNGKEVKMTLEQIRSTGSNYIINGAHPNLEIELAHNLVKGERLGFVYKGNIGWRFTTPSLNVPENTQLGNYPAHDPIGSKTGYNFTIEKNVFGGLFLHFNYGENEYNVVAFENRLPGEKTTVDGKNNGNYDGDYNDMVFLVRTNPEEIKPLEEVDPPSLIFKAIRAGVWIFEDNYPDEGDFDFNDVVIYYQFQQTNYGGKDDMYLTCWLAAKGCDFSNEMGVLLLSSKDNWREPVEKKVMFQGIKGYFNVGEKGDEPVDFTNMPSVTWHFTCKNTNLVRPYLYNGQGVCTPEHFNTSDYPYCIDIPVNATEWFRWPQEGVSLNECYYFLPTRKNDWYKYNNGKNIRPTAKLVNNWKEHAFFNMNDLEVSDQYKKK